VVLEKNGDELDHRVKNEEVLHRVKVERNILHTIIRRNTTRICHILHSNCLLKYVIEEGMDRSDEKSTNKT
jgi:hypothetical protein